MHSQGTLSHYRLARLTEQSATPRSGAAEGANIRYGLEGRACGYRFRFARPVAACPHCGHTAYDQSLAHRELGVHLGDSHEPRENACRVFAPICSHLSKGSHGA